MELVIQNFGPIKGAQIKFGDLTILIGTQASGKSLSLELLYFEQDRCQKYFGVFLRGGFVWGV